MCEICNCRLKSINRSDLNYQVRQSIMFSKKIFYDALVKEKVYSTRVRAGTGNKTRKLAEFQVLHLTKHMEKYS